MENEHKLHNIEGNKIKFTFPDLTCDTDSSNERKVKLVAGNEVNKTLNLKFLYKSPILEQRGLDGIFQITLLSREDVEDFSKRKVLPSKDMLVKFLQLLGAKWTKFLFDCLDVELRYLRDFIHKDIIETLSPRLLRWSEQNTSNKRQLCEEVKQRKWSLGEISMMELSRDEIVQSLCRNFQTSFELRTAKLCIIQCLKTSDVLNENNEVFEGLLPRNCEILAHALMYLPISQLKTAMNNGRSSGLFELTESDDVKRFIEDNNFPDGECLD